VVRVQRLRLANGQPISHQVNYLRPALVPGLTAADLTGNVSLYELLERRYDLRIGWADETIGAHEASRTEAEILQIRPGAAVLTSRRVAYLEDGRPFESSFATIRADCYEYTIHLRGRRRARRDDVP
jgi:GntR family transcriptional regulator